MQRTRRGITAFREQHVHGTKMSGRSFDIIKRLTLKSDLAVLKYRAARLALLLLRGNGQWEKTLRPLLAKDVKALDSYIFDIDLPKQKKQKTGIYGSGSYQIPWIWLMEGAVGSENEDELHSTIRVEWLKSRARANRWREETQFVPVEKQRVLDSFEARAVQWESRLEGWSGLSPEAALGVRALGLRQASVYRRLAAHFRELWLRPPTKARSRRVPDRVEVQELEVADSDGEEAEEEEEEEELQEARELAEGSIVQRDE
ncbi:hypothetical protein BDZ89DRAFT_1045404 [Hymenopellis radicata]|nr:hypothetical protein BDZ89DRAFT_1045404 [Hymenopellis radicata]